jgi:hypothetical protein
MPSITSWTRIEPDPASDDLQTSLSARVLDPLWMLARQWQVGEFQAEDTGTPVMARVRARATPLCRIHLGELPHDTQTQAPPYDPAAVPLEVLVERRAARAHAAGDLRALRLTVDAGLHFLRMLRAAALSRDYTVAFVGQFALAAPDTAVAGSLDADTRTFWRLSAGRALDARTLEAAIRARGAAALAALPALGIAPGDRAEVRDAATAWLAWYDDLVAEPSSPAEDAWVPARLEYQVSVAARITEDPFGERTLTATAFTGGRLDWSSFDVNAEVNTGTTPADHAATASVVSTSVPAPVSVPGAPAVRFWAFEDARLDVGRLATTPTDLAHLLLTEYASSYGNDWFLVPLTLPVGSLTAIDSLVVTDSFGVRTLLRPIGDRSLAETDWSMWQMAWTHRDGLATVPGVERNLFFLPPSLGDALAGPALEDVLLMRDETANLAWGIERTVASPVETAAALNPSPADDDPAAPGGPEDATGVDTGQGGIPSRYRLATSVPSNWVPLVPVEVTLTDGQVVERLQVGAVLQPDGSQRVQAARSELLTVPDLLVFDEEVPREGVGVTEGRRLARWMDGSTWLWAARSVRVGRGEGSSGLRFDSLERGTPGT